MKTINRLITLAFILLCAAFPAGKSRAEAVLREISEKGRVVRGVWQDENGNLTAGPEGYAEVRYRYGRTERTEMYFDAEGTAFRVNGGYAGMTVVRGNHSNITEIIYLNENGEPTATDMGYARIKMTYTSFDGMSSIRYYDADGKKMTVPALGYSGIITTYNGKSVASRMWVDENDNPVNNSDGYAAMRQEMNKSRRPIRTWYERADGSRTMCPDGWSECVRTLDSKGRVICVKYFDAQGQLTDRGAGYAWEEMVYGRNEILITRYRADGGQIPFYGQAMTLKRTTKDDLILTESYLSADGGLTEGPEGVCMIAYTYDKAGRIERVEYRNAAGEAAMCRDGYSEKQYIYDPVTQQAEIRKFDLNGNMVP